MSPDRWEDHVKDLEKIITLSSTINSKHQWHISSSLDSHKSNLRLRKVGALSIKHTKTLYSKVESKFWKGALRIWPIDGQIQGEVVVGTIQSQNT